MTSVPTRACAPLPPFRDKLTFHSFSAVNLPAGLSADDLLDSLSCILPTTMTHLYDLTLLLSLHLFPSVRHMYGLWVGYLCFLHWICTRNVSLYSSVIINTVNLVYYHPTSMISLVYSSKNGSIQPNPSLISTQRPAIRGMNIPSEANKINP